MIGAGDIIIVYLSFWISCFLRDIYTGPSFIYFFTEKGGLLITIWLFSHPIPFYIFELYDERHWQGANLILLLCAALTASFLLLIVLLFFFEQNNMIERWFSLFFLLFAIVFLSGWRKIFKKFLLKRFYRVNKSVFIGHSALYKKIAGTPSLNREGTSLVVLETSSENPGILLLNGCRLQQGLLGFVREFGSKVVVVSQDLRKNPAILKQLLELRLSGVTVYDAPYFYEAVFGKVPVETVKDSWFIFRNQGNRFNPLLYKIVKKILDNILAFLLFLAFLPAFPVICLAVKCSSKGSVFFRQERLGKNMKPFTLLKFRTMVQDAEELTGPKWAEKDDPRVTAVGKILRKTRLDELPQVINVLKGEISFVGPRPIRKHFADMLAKEIPHYGLRFAVKPGLTGWAQVRGDYAGSKQGQKDKLEYDLYYIQNQSVLFDLLIILKTVQTIIFRIGQ